MISSNDEKSTPDIKPFRRYLPQIVASFANFLFMIDLGLALSFSIIVIPALTGDDRVNNPDEFLFIESSQVSWLGSFAFICQAIGSLFSGLLGGPLGRKRAMFVITVPHLIAWLMLFYGNSVTQVFIATALLGLGNGLFESPVLTYIGEISEPSIRGMLTASSAISTNLGIFGTILLGSLMPWRTVAIICFFLPILTIILLIFIPETPHWLLAKRRPDDALKSLQWLRGWVSSQAVHTEFTELQRYNQQSNGCAECERQHVQCNHPPTSFVDKCRDILRKHTLKPSIMILLISVFTQFAGLTSMRSYLVLILKAYGVPMNANWAATVIGMVGLSSSVLLIFTIRLVGKRGSYLTSIGGSCIACFAIGIYGFLYIPADVSSMNNNSTDEIGSNYFPFFAFMALSFFTSYGIYAVVWMMLSEIFPAKSREITTGIAVFGECILMFFASKLHLDLENSLTMPGSAIFYGVVGAVGFVISYFILPETENRTLEEIELHFSDDRKSLLDTDIKKIYNLYEKNVEIESVSKQLKNRK